jgi:hypothetical protein
MWKKQVLSIVVIFSVCLVLAGCDRDRAANAPTATPSPMVSPTPKPTPMPTPMPTPIPTPTPTPTSEPTPKPRPVSQLDPSLDYHPVLFVNSPTEHGDVFTGSYAGEWVSIADFWPEILDVGAVDWWEECDIPLVRGGETYHMCSIRGNAGDVVGSKADYYELEDNRGTLHLTFEPIIPMPEGASVMIGVSGDWDPCPRLASPLTVGMGNRIDLDGDGTEEIIHFEPDPDKPNTVNYILENGAGRTRFDWITFDDTYVVTAEMLFADLNGDGVMEVIQTTYGDWYMYFESCWIYEYKDGVLQLEPCFMIY